MLPEMSMGKQGIATAHFMGNIFAMGGYDGLQYLNSVECYDPLTNGWTLVASMNANRCAARAGTLGDYVYVVGGYNGKKRLSNIERYYHQTNTWTTVIIFSF